MRTWLIVDSGNLLSRNWFAMPAMPINGKKCGAIVGFMQQTLRLRETLGTEGTVFCWDSPTKESVRRKFYRPYKANRAPRPPELLWQEEKLRDLILPGCGFNNVFSQIGYEADDLIAAVAYARCRSAVIVSSDKDLFQCLRGGVCVHGVCVHDPGTKVTWTEENFNQRYGVIPSEWARVKAVMGDRGDNVPGVGGLAEKSALDFVKNELPDGAKRRAVESDAGRAAVRRNLQLMLLPYEGTAVPELEEDEDTPEKIALALEPYGIKLR